MCELKYSQYSQDKKQKKFHFNLIHSTFDKNKLEVISEHINDLFQNLSRMFSSSKENSLVFGLLCNNIC